MSDMSDLDVNRLKYKKSKREENREKILTFIVRSEPSGISTMELEAATDLNHETVSSHCKELLSNGMITKKNKKAKYHLTDRAYGEKTVRAWLFRRKALSAMRSWKIPFSEENSFSNIDDEDLTTENHDKLMFFSLANWIGSFMIYTFIDAIRPEVWVPKINLKKKKISDEIRGKSKDKLVVEWIKEVIDPIDFFKEFLKLDVVKKGLSFNNPRNWNASIIMGKMRPEIRTRLLENPRSMKKYQDSITANNKKQEEIRKFEYDNFKRSLYEMDQTNFAKLIKTFGDVFPHHLTEFEKVRNTLKS